MTVTEMVRSTEMRSPRNMAEAKSALSMKRARNEDRIVHLPHVRTHVRRQVIPVNVHESNSLFVTVMSGIPTILVQSGHVTINPDSSWGNVIQVDVGASAELHVDPARKVTVRNEGSVTIRTSRSNRIFVCGDGDVEWTYREDANG